MILNFISVCLRAQEVEEIFPAFWPEMHKEPSQKGTEDDFLPEFRV